MSFGFNLAGTPQECLTDLDNCLSYPSYSDNSQRDAVAAFVKSELEQVGEGVRVVVDASGHHDAFTRTLNVSFRTMYIPKKHEKK